MFYSHDILTSRQYGVATVWLVATVGSRSSARKVTRKAIQEVDVQGACEQILEPGAPIALRLQGNLLYGLSRVHNQQCSYILTDAHKIQGSMMTLFRQLDNALKDDAGTARREQLVISDDPDFIPTNVLPQMDPDMFNLSQATKSATSQMSPNTTILSGPGSARSSSGNEGVSPQWGTQHSDLSDLPIPEGLGKPFRAQNINESLEEGLNVFEDDAVVGDFQLEVDEFGNIVEMGDGEVAIADTDGLDLPPMPTIEDQMAHQRDHDAAFEFVGMEEQPLPDAEALPPRDDLQEGEEVAANNDQVTTSAPSRRRRRHARLIEADENTTLARNDMKAWMDNYLENCCQPKFHQTTQAQARKNAIWFTFGSGVGNIGKDLAFPGIIDHPLLQYFSGDSLFTAVTGLEIVRGSSRKRRSSSAEVGSDEDGDRHVRQRLGDEGAEHDRQTDIGGDIGMFDVGADDAPEMAREVGREGEAAMSDHPSSAVSMPWHRNSSAQPASSRHDPGSSKIMRGRTAASSPLARRGNMDEIVRYSDEVDMSGGVDFVGGFSDDGDAQDGFQGAAHSLSDTQTTSQALNREGREFLTFITERVQTHGERRNDEDFDMRRKWVAFNDVFEPAKTPRATAAQAFYHVLSLVTKGEMSVEQEGDKQTPFQPLHVGLLESTFAKQQ